MLSTSLENLLNNKDFIRYDYPFPHFIIRNLFDEHVLEEIANNEILFDTKGNWSHFSNDKELKFQITPNQIYQESKVMKILNFLNGEDFVNFLRELTGINDLTSDPSFLGGGIHMIPPKGKLGIHIDFSRHPNFIKPYRRCNVLLYLNKNWLNEYGGALELWTDRPKAGGVCAKKIYPIFNTLVVFGTAKNSWHGHPNPLNTPEGIYRKSLATYYYSDFPSDDTEDHGTVFGD